VLLLYLVIRGDGSGDQVDVSEKTNANQVEAASKTKTETKKNSILNVRENDTFKVHIKLKNCTPVHFSINGKLDKSIYNWKTGDKVIKNDLLFALNNEIPYLHLVEDKRNLKFSLEQLLKNAKTLSDSDFLTLQDYTLQITETDFLPESNWNRVLLEYLKKEGILELILKIEIKEKEMFNYFYLSPIDGYIVVVKTKKSGSKIAKNESIAYLSNVENVGIEVPLPTLSFTPKKIQLVQGNHVFYEEIHFTSKQAKKIQFNLGLADLKKINPFEKVDLIVSY
jgi:hypothetical protein